MGNKNYDEKTQQVIKNILKKVLFHLGVTSMIGLLGAFIYSGVYLIIKIHNGTLSESEGKCIEMYKKYLR